MTLGANPTMSPRKSSKNRDKIAPIVLALVLIIKNSDFKDI